LAGFSVNPQSRIADVAAVRKILLLVMLNSTNVVSEILTALVGSFGPVTVALFSALIGVFLDAVKDG